MEKNIKILIVEDESLVARWLHMELSAKGFDVCGLVATGEEAIEIAKQEKPCIILMDINLAGNIDGIDAARSIIDGYDVGIIFMTAYSEKKMMDRIESTQSIGFISKPVEIKYILDIIEDSYFSKN